MAFQTQESPPEGWIKQNLLPRKYFARTTSNCVEGSSVNTFHPYFARYTFDCAAESLVLPGFLAYKRIPKILDIRVYSRTAIPTALSNTSLLA
ncbi:hypothetical protein PanWU01x14_235850 [Parasponia andersonii]|uniref:Uncharacterized protein n=1 Tax=Parasponia andersonii TaxID=3476 RepID=A0A2P5BIU8_PARAD|nr:hypothetical protein PanWU01x14_235850 [Parasponia andersonii]